MTLHSAEIIIQLFGQLASQGKTILIVTHDPSITRMTDRTVIISDGEIIDETVSKALPLLDHQQLLHATRLVQRKVISRGETIIHQGEHVENLYMIAGGEVNIVLNNPACPEIMAVKLGSGEFFGEIELMRGGHFIASVQAAEHASVELVMLSHDSFYEVIAGSPLTEEALSKIVQKRFAEN